MCRLQEGNRREDDATRRPRKQNGKTNIQIYDQIAIRPDMESLTP